MSIQVQEIIDRIRSEGVKAAQDEASSILSSAQAEAQTILAKAEADAEAIRQAAAKDALREAESGKQALAQAARDTLLSLRKEIQSTLDAIISADTGAAMGPDAVAQALPKILSGMAGSDELQVILGGDAKAYSAAWLAALKQKLRQGVDLLPQGGGKAGFRIVERAGAAYYDYSSEALSGLVSRHLNPQLAQIMKSAVREG